jgi:hypothetical protein
LFLINKLIFTAFIGSISKACIKLDVDCWLKCAMAKTGWRLMEHMKAVNRAMDGASVTPHVCGADGIG